MFDAIAVAIEADKDRLCELDGVIGDADHGIAMALGFGAARDALAALDLAAIEPTALLNTAAKSFLNAVGASSGPLYATAFMRAAAAVKGKAALDDADVVALFQAMAQGHQGSRQGRDRRKDDDRRLAAGGRSGGRRACHRQVPG